IGRFTLPEESWWKGYYDPLQERVRLMRETHGGDPEMRGMLDAEEMEMASFRKYCRFYGYVFYVMRKPWN
ncbi:MAG: class I SAM-dependent methyltransferase, partial [Spirochaetes bacterium]|nr:class I SAM-dependent methyltransferase [Spirochaetota bacterium]